MLVTPAATLTTLMSSRTAPLGAAGTATLGAAGTATLGATGTATLGATGTATLTTCARLTASLVLVRRRTAIARPRTTLAA